MNSRDCSSQVEVKLMNTQQLRSAFVIEELFVPGEIRLTYSHYDRLIIGGIQPAGNQITMPTPEILKAKNFLERREMGVINLGSPGRIHADNTSYTLNHLDVLYLGQGSQGIRFEDSSTSGALFYILSAPAHHPYPAALKPQADATPLRLGSQETANSRTVYKYIFTDGIPSCQLVMGVTILDPGNVWNTMPPHTHDRRMEAYIYFNLAEQHRVSHFMGSPEETRHLWLKNLQAVISPPWSIHSGCGTSSYGFVWGMAGENKDYTDMDVLTLDQIK
jgi:4-deoxy-L-threo-5-hexosulose-uronate ketol-isomerase